MKTVKNTFLVILCAITILQVSAQESMIKSGMISGKLLHKGDSMHIDMIIDLTNLSFNKNRALTITPVISGMNRQKELPEVLINGTTRHKVYERSLKRNNKTPEFYTVIKLNENNKKQFQYKAAIPYESWMDSSVLDVKEDLCGCGKFRQESDINRIAIYQRPPVYAPWLAYIQPEVEKIKTREDSWESYLDFPVNKTQILSGYMNNSAELSKVESLFNSLRSDNNLAVQSIEISGYASPEGGIAHNEQLSKGRAEAFKTYIQTKMYFPASVYRVTYGGENWQGLQDALVSSDINDKEEILDIIRNTDNINTRKEKIKALNGGVTYQRILTEIYPKLRKVVSTAQYNVREFSVDEAKEIFKTRPQQLSLDEMYRIANTYEAGSPEFTDVFETAVRMFPEDKIANLNAAAAALSVKDIEKAKKYLEKSDKESPEYSNNMGIIYFYEGNTDQAEAAFNEARRKGLNGAEHNVKGIEYNE